MLNPVTPHGHALRAWQSHTPETPGTRLSEECFGRLIRVHRTPIRILRGEGSFQTYVVRPILRGHVIRPSWSDAVCDGPQTPQDGLQRGLVIG